MSQEIKPRIRRKSSAIKVGPQLARSNTITASITGSNNEDEDQFSVPNLPPNSLSSALDTLKNTVNKRISTWSTIKLAHQGKVHWFGSILLDAEDLAHFDVNRMRLRTLRFSVLGMSLSSILDINPPHDFLRSLLILLSEFDNLSDDKFETESRKSRSVFRSTAKAKRSTVGSDFLQDSSDASYLSVPNIPFDLDYFQVLFTISDMLIDVYSKISSYLTNSPSLSPALTEVVSKVDVRLNKIAKLVTSDLDTLARKCIKNELSGLLGGDWSADAIVDIP